MNEDINVKSVKDAYMAFEDRNIPALLRCLTDDVRWFEVGPPDLIPTAGTRKGREQVEEFFKMLEASEEVQSFRTESFRSARGHGSGVGRTKEPGQIDWRRDQLSLGPCVHP
jgi:ketosteroid isomerase-like protein